MILGDDDDPAPLTPDPSPLEDERRGETVSTEYCTPSTEDSAPLSPRLFEGRGVGGEGCEAAPPILRIVRHLAPLVSLALAVAWGYRATFTALVQRWNTDPVYSHGYVVVLLAAVILVARRTQLRRPLHTSWTGVPWLVVAAAVHLAGAFLFVEWFESISLLVCLCGVAALLGGRVALRWSGPAIAFLVFMIPLPFRAEQALAQPLQTLATKAGTYTLQTLGVSALAEGNVIVLDNARMGVAEACSGLRMLLIFLALATAIAMLIEQPQWLKAVLVSSAVPIALVSNWVRITATGVLHATVSSEAADRFFHDFAGWMMMPLALALLWVELRLLAARPRHNATVA